MKMFLELQPTANQSFRLIGSGARGNLVARLEQSYKAEQNGNYEGACELRYAAFEDILSTLPDDEQGVVTLDRNHPNTLAADLIWRLCSPRLSIITSSVSAKWLPHKPNCLSTATTKTR